ncbi:MAG: lactate dehydrogenase [Bacillota bacterium]|nr:lactate dehydrogenase [Bacillota bacterium]
MRYLRELVDGQRPVEKRENSFLLKSEESGTPTDFGSAGGALGAHGKAQAAGVRAGCRVNLLALGDVGGTVLLGLRLLGADVIGSIGIYDLNEKLLSRYEREINQIAFPDGRTLPQVKILEEEQLFDCEMFIFCASKGVPQVGKTGEAEDVRMVQLKANSRLVRHYASMAAEHSFKGIFAVVSDPVDLLCKAALSEGLSELQVQGYGLGVMNGRARYFAERHQEFAGYLKEGRAFGPHGEDLVIANSIENYDDELSRRLTELTVRSNLDTREDGFKPYIAPAISSGAISLTETLRGNWNYSSVYFGKGNSGAFLGCRNRRLQGSGEGDVEAAFAADNTVIEVENLPLPESLYERIKNAYDNLKEIRG